MLVILVVGVTVAVVVALYRWYLKRWVTDRLAILIGKTGRGGSGCFIDLEDGSMAVLTARHVIVRCILSGEITVARLRPATQRSIEPRKIRIDSHHDVGYVGVDRTVFSGKSLSYAQWTTPTTIRTGQRALVSGAVGEWKRIDVHDRKLLVPAKLTFNVRIRTPRDARERIVSVVNEKPRNLPLSFRGISGGPLVSLGRRLIGVVVQETISTSLDDERELFSTPVDRLRELFEPFTSSIDDYMWQPGGGRFLVADEQTGGSPALIVVEAAFYWSSTVDSGPLARVGRITSIRIEEPHPSSRYVINTESIFSWEGDNTEANRLAALQPEIALLLERSGFVLVQSQP